RLSHCLAARPARHFFVTLPARPELYTLSLHDALPISVPAGPVVAVDQAGAHAFGELRVATAVQAQGVFQAEHLGQRQVAAAPELDRKSTRLNSSHVKSSYAVFCLKKKKTDNASEQKTK